jgi:hypothetical protein
MKVKDLKSKGKTGYGDVLQVYAIYWSNNVTYFLLSPNDYMGFIAYLESEIEVVEPYIGEDMVFNKSASGASMILHVDLIADSLLDKVIDDGQTWFPVFQDRLNARFETNKIKKLERLDLDVKSAAIDLGSGWFQCSECLDAWVPKVLTRILECPYCQLKQRNPECPLK